MLSNLSVYSAAEILESPQLQHRDAFEELASGDARARVVGLPFRLVTRGADADLPERRRTRSLPG